MTVRLPNFCVDCAYYFSPGAGYAPVCKAPYPGTYDLVTGKTNTKEEVTCASCRAGACGSGAAYFLQKVIPECPNCGAELAAGQKYCSKDCELAYLRRTLLVVGTKYGTDYAKIIEEQLPKTAEKPGPGGVK
jgi:hypothetical protein